MTKWASVELGGTKTLVGVGRGPDDLDLVTRIPTTEDPRDVIGAVVSSLDGVAVEALGLASFGPLTLDRSSPKFGRIESTPKPGWSGFDVLSEMSKRSGLRVAIDTDVNAAALAEGRWGVSQGARHHAYITVGTGIGFGVVIDGNLMAGSAHPEMGHVPVERQVGDGFAGVCPYHGDCLEGMASGLALAERFGSLVEHLDDAQQLEALDIAAFYLGQGLRTLNYSFAPEVVVVGGGVSRLEGFHSAVESAFRTSVSEYREPETPLGRFVVAPGLGERSGLAGGLILASQAAT